MQNVVSEIEGGLGGDFSNVLKGKKKKIIKHYYVIMLSTGKTQSISLTLGFSSPSHIYWVAAAKKLGRRGGVGVEPWLHYE